MKKEDKAQLVASTGVAITGAMVTGAALPGLGVLPLSLKALVMEYNERSERKFWIDLVENLQQHGSEGVRDKVEDLIFNLQSRENTLKIISTAWRSLMESNDPCVGPALSVLAAMYFNRPPDGFFRGLCRVLIELNWSEFTELQQFTASAVALPSEIDKVYVDYMPGSANALDSKGKPMAGVWLHHLSLRETEFHVGHFEHIERLCYLLKSNGFELPPTDTRTSRGHYGHILTYLDKMVLSRIAEVIGPPPTPGASLP